MGSNTLKVTDFEITRLHGVEFSLHDKEQVRVFPMPPILPRITTVGNQTTIRDKTCNQSAAVFGASTLEVKPAKRFGSTKYPGGLC